MTCARRTLTAQTVGCVMVVLAKANDDKIGKSDQAAAPAQTNRAHHEPYSTKASFADAGTAHTGRVDFLYQLIRGWDSSTGDRVHVPVARNRSLCGIKESEPVDIEVKAFAWTARFCGPVPT